MGSSSLTHSSNPFRVLFISIFIIQILLNITNSWIFCDIGRNCLLGNRKKIGKFLMRTFTYHSTFLYADDTSVKWWRGWGGGAPLSCRNSSCPAGEKEGTVTNPKYPWYHNNCQLREVQGWHQPETFHPVPIKREQGRKWSCSRIHVWLYTLFTLALKGQCHEIFGFRLFFMDHLPPSPWK
jgi:hypothetical protein